MATQWPLILNNQCLKSLLIFSSCHIPVCKRNVSCKLVICLWFSYSNGKVPCWVRANLVDKFQKNHLTCKYFKYSNFEKLSYKWQLIYFCYYVNFKQLHGTSFLSFFLYKKKEFRLYNMTGSLSSHSLMILLFSSFTEVYCWLCQWKESH